MEALLSLALGRVLRVCDQSPDHREELGEVPSKSLGERKRIPQLYFQWKQRLGQPKNHPRPLGDATRARLAAQAAVKKRKRLGARD